MKKLLYSALAVSIVGASALAANVYASGDGYHGKGKRAEKMFNRLDTNNDSLVSMEEFLVKAQERFHEFDADKDGSVSLAEAKEHLKSWKGKWHHKKQHHDDHDHASVTPVAPVE